MGDLLGSFPRCVRVRPKYAEKTCIGLWGQSTIFMSSHQRSGGLGVLHYLPPKSSWGGPTKSIRRKKPSECND